MSVFIVRRLSQSLLVLFITSIIVFAGIYAIGNPVDILIAGDATPAEREQAIRALGLDRSLLEQYGTFIWNALQGDLGRSFVFNQPSIDLILNRMPATLELAFVALALSLVLGIPLGLWAGLRPGTALDETVMTGSILGFSLPNFWQGMMLIMIFSVWLGWLPSTGRGEVGYFFGNPDKSRDLVRPVPSHSAGSQSCPVQHLSRHPSHPERRARDDAARLREVRASQGVVRAPDRISFMFSRIS